MTTNCCYGSTRIQVPGTLFCRSAGAGDPGAGHLVLIQVLIQVPGTLFCSTLFCTCACGRRWVSPPGYEAPASAVNASRAARR